MDKGNVFVYGSYLKTFERACSAKEEDPAEVLRRLGNRKDSLSKSLRSARGPSSSALQGICDYFEITADSFLSGFIDLKWIAGPHLPGKYRFSAGSKFLTSLVVLDYVRRKQGEVFLNHALRHLKIPRKLLQRPDERVSIQLLSDLLEYLRTRGFTLDEITNMGRHSASLGENAKIKRHFVELSEREVFEKLFEEVVVQYEENFDYRIISSEERSICVQASAKDSRVEDFRSPRIDNLAVSFYRHGVCASHLKHAELPIASSAIVSSLHLGDRTEQFKIAW